MLASGKQLSIKVENLARLAPPQPAAVRTGGDLGPEWNSVLERRGISTGLPLTAPLAAEILPPPGLCDVPFSLAVVAPECGEPRDDQMCGLRGLCVAAAQQPSPVDALLAQAEVGDQATDAFEQAGFARVDAGGAAADQRDVVFLCPQDCAWEVIGAGAERISTDAGPAGACRSHWARLQARASSGVPCVFLGGARLAGQTRLEDRLQLTQRLLELFRLEAREDDLGILVGDFLATDAESEDDTPLAALREGGWRLACLRMEGTEGSAVRHIGISQDVPVAAEIMQRSETWRIERITFQLRPRTGAGALTGLGELPVLGLGTCLVPEDLHERVPDKEYRNRVDELTEHGILAALEVGVRLFDCSNSHINQQTVGRTLEGALQSGRVSRSDIFVVGRLWRCRDRDEVRREVDKMLGELRLEYVDLLMADVPPERAPGTWPWLEEMHRHRRTRYLATSNFDLLGPKVCTEMFRDFMAHVEIPPAVHCMEVHPFNTNEEMSECCRAMGIQVMAYSPMGAPHKIEAFLRCLTKSDARDMRPLLKIPENPAVQEIGKRHRATAAQVALRWNLQRGHCVVPKSFDPQHVEENAKLFHFQLSPDEMATVTSMHKGVRSERFFQQAHCSGSKALPKMTRDAQDACVEILNKMRGGAKTEEAKMRAEIAKMMAAKARPAGNTQGRTGYPR